MPLAISYARFSSTRQALGESLRRQMEATQSYCQQHGLTLDETVKDEGLSAFTGRHLDRDAGLGALIERIRKGEIPAGSVLICEAHDRLSRLPARIAMQLFLGIINSGIDIVTLVDGQRYCADTLDQNGQLYLSIGLMRGAHAESETKSKRVRQARQKAREVAAATGKIISRTVPAWVDVAGDRFVLNAGADTVLRIYKEAAAGLGTYTISKRLNAEHIPTLSGGKKSNGWNKSRILAILKSDAPLGWFQPHVRDEHDRRKPVGEPIQGYYPAIVDQSLADRARQMIAGRSFGGTGAGRKGSVYSNLFSGIAKCAVCGGSMFLSHRHMPRSKAGWLRCSRAVRSQDCTNLASVPYTNVEQFALDQFFWGLQIKQEVDDDPAARIKAELAQKTEERRKTEEASARIIEEFAASPNSLVKQQIERMADRVERLNAEIPQLERKAASVIRPDLLPKSWQKMLIAKATASDQNERLEARTRIANELRLHLDRIECGSDRSVRVFFKTWETKMHRLQVHYGLNWQNEVWKMEDEESGRRYLLTMRIEANGRSEDVCLGTLSPTVAVMGILDKEARGLTYFDPDTDTEPHVVSVPPIELQKEVVAFVSPHDELVCESSPRFKRTQQDV